MSNIWKKPSKRSRKSDSDANHESVSLMDIPPPPKISKCNSGKYDLKWVDKDYNLEDDLSFSIKNLDFDVLKLNNCPSIRAVIDILNEPKFESELAERSNSKVIGLIFKINNLDEKDFDRITTKEFTKLHHENDNGHLPETISKDNLCEGASLPILSRNTQQLVISFESATTSKNRIYWKSAARDYFLWVDFINTPNLPADSACNLMNFTIEFLIKELHHNCTGLLTSYDTSTFSEIPIDLLSDDYKSNLLMLAVELDQILIVKSLLKFQFNINHCNYLGKTAAAVAYENKNFEILLELLKANSRYPDGFKIEKASVEVQEFVEETNNLHKAIAERDIEMIKNIINGNKELRYFYSVTNDSAATKALLEQKLDIYQILIDRNVFVCSLELSDRITKNLSEEEKESLRAYHATMEKKFPNEHLTVLRANSRVVHDELDPSSKLKYVKEAFDYLNKIVTIKIILELVAKSRNFKIVFDFQRSLINYIDPTLKCLTRAVYCSSGTIYVAAKEFLDESTRKEGYGTLIHELCHYAMNLAYKNKCRPYTKTDLTLENEFCDISNKCFDERRSEEIIKSVFDNYDSHPQQHAELIARVPQLLTIYNEDANKLEEFKNNYCSLFEYFNKVIIDFKGKKICEIETTANQFVVKYHEKTKREKRENYCLRWMVAGIAIIAMILLWFYYKHICLNCQWKDLWEFQKTQCKETFVNFQGARVKFGNLIEGHEDAAFKLTIDELYDLRHKKHLTIGKNYMQKFNRTYCVEMRFNLTQSITDLQNKMESEKMLVITGGAGTGKSTALHKIIFDMKNNVASKDSLKWIMYIKLGDFRNDFKKMEFFRDDEIFLINEILKDQEVFKVKETSNNHQPNDNRIISEFQQELLKFKFQKDEVVIFWDALDEIAFDGSDSKALNFIQNINTYSNNSQWITTRMPSNILELESRLDTSVFHLQPLTTEETNSFLKCHIESKFDFDTAKSLQERVENALQNIQDKDSITNRLLITMIVTLFWQSINNDTDVNLNLHFDIFNTLARNNIVENSMLHDDLVRKTYDGNDGRWECHYVVALEMILGGTYLDEINRNYFNAQTNKNYQTESDDFYGISGSITIDALSIIETYQNFNVMCRNLTSFKIVHYDSNGNLAFQHRTYAEFFVAKYLSERLYQHRSTSNIDLRILASIASYQDFNFIRKLLLQSLQIRDENGVDTKRVASEIVNEFPNIFEHLNYDLETIDFLSTLFKRNDSVIKVIWKYDESKTVFHEYLKYNYDSKLMEKLPKIMEIVEKAFSNDSTKLTRGRNQDLFILSLVWFVSNETFGSQLLKETNLEIYDNYATDMAEFALFAEFYFYAKSKIDSDRKEEILKEFFTNYFSIIFSMYIDTKDESETIWEDIKRENILSKDEICKLFSHISLSGSNILHEYVYRNDDTEYLNSFLSKCNDSEIIKNLILMQENNSKSTPLMYVTWKGSVIDTFYFYWNFTKKHLDTETFKKHLKATNIHHFTALHLSAWHSEKEFFIETFKFYEEVFKNELKEIMFTSRTSTNKLFILSLVNTASKEVCENVMKTLINLYGEDSSTLKTAFDESGVKDNTTWCDLNENF